MLSIVGTQSAYVNSKKALCMFDKDINGANTVLERAIQKKHFKNMVEDSSKISSYIITENGMIYSSSVSIRTLVNRLNKQDIYSCPLISGQAYIICDKIESVFELKTNEQIDNTRYIPIYYQPRSNQIISIYEI